MTKEKNISKKDIFLCILIFILFFFPVLKLFKNIFVFAEGYHYSFLRVIGLLGVYVFITVLSIKLYKSENKKQFLIDYLPVLLLFIFMIWTLFSSLLSNNKYLAFYGTSYRIDGYISYIAYAGCFGLAFCISSDKLKKYLLYLFVIIVFINALITHISSTGKFFNILLVKDIKLSSFYNINHYAYYLLIGISVVSFLFVTENKVILKLICALIYTYLLYILIINNTFGCYLALILSLIIFWIFCFRKKEKLWPVTILIFTFIIVSFFSNITAKNIPLNNFQSFGKDLQKIVGSSNLSNTNSSWKSAGSGRLLLWTKGLEFILQKPIFGYGPENLENEYAKYGIHQDRPHNLLIQLATTSGIPGLLLYLGAIGIILFRSIKNFDINNQVQTVCTFSIIAYLISAFFGNSMYTTSPYYFMLVGLLFNEIISLKKAPTKK